VPGSRRMRKSRGLRAAVVRCLLFRAWGSEALAAGTLLVLQSAAGRRVDDASLWLGWLLDGEVGC
jgi:hypothetical protein